jgi:predicted Zn-dependent protease with MMP-like domain
MFSVTQEEFEKYVADGLDALPARYQKNLNNVVIVVEDYPTPEQISKQKLGPGRILLGLYEGIPLTSRGNNYSGVLPDKITLFKVAIESMSQSQQQLTEQIRHTLWHEVAHFYGLDHIEINKRDK